MRTSVCPDDCEYKDFEYSLYGRTDYCTLEYGMEETLEETKLNSGKFKRTEFCRKIKLLEESKMIDKEKCKMCVNGDGNGGCEAKDAFGFLGAFTCDDGESFEPISDEVEEQKNETNQIILHKSN